MQPVVRFPRSSHVKTLGFAFSSTARSFAKMSAAETDNQAAQAAEPLGVTPASLKTALKEKLQAHYVDVEDMSGKSYRQAGMIGLSRVLTGCCFPQAGVANPSRRKSCLPCSPRKPPWPGTALSILP